MIRQCFETNTGIQFHGGSFKRVGLDVNTLYPVVLSRPPALDGSKPTGTSHAAEPTDSTLVPTSHPTFKSEEDEELKDALSPIFDALKLHKAWWILEVLPLQYSEQDRITTKWRPYWAYVITQFMPWRRVTQVRCSQDKHGPRSRDSKTDSREGGRASQGASLRKDQNGGRGSKVQTPGEV